MLLGKGTVSAPIRATRRILARCPFAPTTSKLSFEGILTAIWGHDWLPMWAFYLELHWV